MIQFTEKNGSLIFNVKVVPRASQSGIVGEYDGNLRVRISAPPVDGGANRELIRLLATHLGVAKSNIEIVAGHMSKTKQIRIDGVTAVQTRNLIGD